MNIPAGFRIRIDLMRIRIRIRIQPFFYLRIRIPDPDPGFDDQLKFKKIYSWKFNFYFLDQTLQFTYPWASIKDAQATGEAFSPQKRTSRNWNMKILDFFLFLWFIFALLNPDPCGFGSGYGSGFGTLHPGSYFRELRNNFLVTILKLNSFMRMWIRILDLGFFFTLDPGSGIWDLRSGIRDGKNSDPGSGINIRNPQHCWKGIKHAFIFSNAGAGLGLYFRRIQN